MTAVPSFFAPSVATAPVLAHTATVALDLAAAGALAIGLAAVTRRRALPAIVAGLVAQWVAAAPPIHDRAETSVAWHMVQHLLLTMVAAPLLGWAIADAVLRGPRWARTARKLAFAPAAVIVAAVLHAATVLVWHYPSLYDAADAGAAVHAVQHVTLFATALWFWSTVVHHARRRAAPLTLLGLLVAATGGAVLGAMLMFAEQPLYAGAGDVTDQAIAGALMMAVGGFVCGVVAMAVLAGLVARSGDGPRSTQIGR